MLKKIRENHFAVYCMLLVILFSLVSPQVVCAAATSDVTLAVEQVISKPAGSTAADTFTYILKAHRSDNPMPADSSGGTYAFIVSGTDMAAIEPIIYSMAGTYSYEIKQAVTSAQTGYTYDMQVYTVYVYAKNISGGLKTEVVVIKENGYKVSAIIFENSYAPLASDPSIMVDPPVKKTVSGIPNEDGTFTFKLEAQNKTSPMPADSTEGVKLVTIMGPGEVEFGTWSYTETGIYVYAVSEVPNGEKGYAYDTGVYTITDRVTDVNGQLVVNRTVTDSSNKPVDFFEFVNKYTSGSGGNTSNTKAVKTSDDTRPELYQVILFIDGSMLIAFVVYMIIVRKKRLAASEK